MPLVSAALLIAVTTIVLHARSAQVPSALFRWVNEDVVYIITDQERAVFTQLQSDEEREEFIEQFWQRRDPTPGTPENEFRDEHYRRIEYANERFGLRGMVGWQTDRGRILIMYGKPDEIESHAAGGTYVRPNGQGGVTTVTLPFEIWGYRYIEGIGNNVLLQFVDPTATGEYRLAIDPNAKRDLLFQRK
jgi:GWxTD domain-containing protein